VLRRIDKEFEGFNDKTSQKTYTFKDFESGTSYKHMRSQLAELKKDCPEVYELLLMACSDDCPSADDLVKKIGEMDKQGKIDLDSGKKQVAAMIDLNNLGELPKNAKKLLLAAREKIRTKPGLLISVPRIVV